MEIEKLIQRLRDRGYKLTPQRIAIIDILLSDKSHSSAYEIFVKARLSSPKISISTVYYTLNMLKQEGLIKEIEFYNKANRYDANIANHINLVCIKCSKIEDYMDIPLSSLRDIEDKTGFIAQSIRFEFYGYCNDCKDVK